jgi:adenylate cyclase, class 2
MHKEIEVKFLDIDVFHLKQKLLSLGATCVFSGIMKAVYFSHPTLEKNTLRLRQEGKQTILAYKIHHHSTFGATKDEYEVEISDLKAMQSILLHMGYTIEREFDKYRESYKLKSWSFEFDTLKGIPTFLEIEAQSQKELSEAIQILELSPEEAKSWSGREVRLYYEKNRKKSDLH